jgi:hypothetical protein
VIRINLYRVRPEELDRLRAWMEELNRRQDEVRQTFEREGVRHETACLYHDAEGPVLAYAVECEDWGRAMEAFEASPLPIDHEHAEVMQEVVESRIDARVLYSCDLGSG